ncbi:trifunctional dihydropteroate synthetase [Steccherinum ochraceum]|uniref:Trifunctional dihydropteroate synthetase n=1 Tax=Steccherinum ochraceum TaxID=92696 RepID=A0A4R0REW4_9APHY|nr:trifunctional dihydropteroate synthetase [Steccherinum ochraceum]
MSSRCSVEGDLEQGSSTQPLLDGRDVIRVKNLAVMASFSDGAQWPSDNPKLQPVHITLDIVFDITRAADTDDLVHSIDYSAVCKTITASCDASTYKSLEDLCHAVLSAIFDGHGQVQDAAIHLTRTRALLHPATTGIRASRTRDKPRHYSEELLLSSLEYRTIIGINDCERVDTQLVRCDVELVGAIRPNATFQFRDLERRIQKHVIQSSYLTLEAFAGSVAQLVLDFDEGHSDYVTVRASKPSALVCAEGPEVEITRCLRDGKIVAYRTVPIASRTEAPLAQFFSSVPSTSASSSSGPTRAALALGSNLGDRFANIELALRILETPGVHYSRFSEDAFVDVVDTSFMYETEPMYVSDQPKFINCACLVETNLTPLELLTLLKRVETIVGRVTSFRNGPRAIDLDILTYEGRVIDTRPVDGRSASLDDLEGHLVVPHPRMLEREFVLRPLADILPEYIHPNVHRSIKVLFQDLIGKQLADTPQMNKVLPFPRYPFCRPTTPTEPVSSQLPQVPAVPPTATYWKFPVVSTLAKPHKTPKRKTYIMGTLNVTPDSFSDGSVNNSIPAALKYARGAAEAGADILDIGGYSTRPGAAYVPPEEELTRVVPVIQAIRSQTDQGNLTHAAREILISVDTFRWEVAEEAVHAGANCINDVYAFRGSGYPVDASSDEHFSKMRQVARDLAVPVILMHSRGEAPKNKDYSAYEYAEDGSTVEGVRVELGDRVESIVKGRGGLRRWYVVTDPGLGFSKTVEGNLELLHYASTFSDPDTRSGNPPRPNPLAGYPLLIGASRKSFLGSLLEKQDEQGTYPGRETKASERDFATSAAVAWAVQQRADIVRVHSVMELGDVVRIASAIMGV